MSRVIIFGADGFIGKNVKNELKGEHEVYVGTRHSDYYDSKSLQVDLLNTNDISKALSASSPEVIINCAGVVDPNKDAQDNVRYTKNIFEALAKTGVSASVIISGSAGAYGVLDSESELPVSENTPLRAAQGYVRAKKEEEELALEYSRKLGIPTTVLRIFNPIGVGMADKFLIPRLLKQLDDVNSGLKQEVEISRLDSSRDYIAVEDVAKAFRAIIEGKPSHNIYNVGSGVSTTNGELLELLVKSSKIEPRPPIIETQESKEALVASQANIQRMTEDFKWQPTSELSSVIQRIVDNEPN